MHIPRRATWVGAILGLVFLAACDAELSQKETGARTIEGARMGAGIMVGLGYGDADKPIDFDASSISFIPRPETLAPCGHLRAGLDRRWPQKVEDGPDAYTLESKFDLSTHDLRQTMAVLVDVFNPIASAEIQCEKTRYDKDLSAFVDHLARRHREKGGNTRVERGTFDGPSGQWQTIYMEHRSASGRPFDSYTAFKLQGGKRIRVTLFAFREAGNLSSGAERLPAGAVTTVQGVHGKPLTLRLTRAATRDGNYLSGQRSAAENMAFFRKFMGLLR